jgi:hypothetical protein
LIRGSTRSRLGSMGSLRGSTHTSITTQAKAFHQKQRAFTDLEQEHLVDARSAPSTDRSLGTIRYRFRDGSSPRHTRPSAS